jgi:hypothetical protein
VGLRARRSLGGRRAAAGRRRSGLAPTREQEEDEVEDEVDLEDAERRANERMMAGDGGPRSMPPAAALPCPPAVAMC